MYVFKFCAAILQDFGHLKISSNVSGKEKLPCFLYLIQIFAYLFATVNYWIKGAVLEKETQGCCFFVRFDLSNSDPNGTAPYLKTTKGQIISKGFLMSSISSKKRTKEFNFTTMIPQVDLFSFVFWRRNQRPQKTISKWSDL